MAAVLHLCVAARSLQPGACCLLEKPCLGLLQAGWLGGGGARLASLRCKNGRGVRVRSTKASDVGVAARSDSVKRSGSSQAGLRPLEDILRDLHTPAPTRAVKKIFKDGTALNYLPWYYVNRVLTNYAPGWEGEIRSILYAPDNGTVTVVYRVTIHSADGATFRESSGTAPLSNKEAGDPVQIAESMAFRRACARFGIGLYLYEGEQAS